MRIGFLRGRAARTAGGTSSTFFTVLAVAVLAAAVGASLPAEAGKRKNAAKPVEATLPDPADGEPMTLVVSLSQQKVDVYRGLTLITSSGVSTGMRGYATKAGVFSVLEKRRLHHSNLYSGAPMPWMNRITWSGTALHAGVVPGYPASHGCIRLPFSFAPKLFKITTVGDNVIVARDRPAPQLIEHANLFQPLPPPLPSLVKEEQPKHQTQNEVLPVAPAKARPRMLARADVSNSATDVPSVEAEAVRQRVAPPKNDPAAVEDTHAHAFDPLATDAPAELSHNTRARNQAGTANAHALGEEGAPEPSFVKAEPSPTVTASAESKPTETATSPALPAGVAAVAATLKPADATASAANAAEPASAEAKPAPAEPAAMALAEASPAVASPLQPLDVPPSAIAAKLMAGAKEAAILAAEPRSTAPLRILVTRRTQRDRIIGVQRIFADMGYLERQEFDGTLGKATVTAIKKFQAANGMPETGAINDELVKKVYEVAGKGEPPAGHLYVRQEFGRVFDAPVSFKDPETPLGTHLFTAMKFAPGETSTRWLAMSLQGDDSAAALDRLEIPGDVRQKISERLTPGSSLIIGDTAINTAGLTKGNDFVVWAKETPAKITSASADGDFTPAKRKKKKARTVRRPFLDYGYRSQRTPGFARGSAWPW